MLYSIKRKETSIPEISSYLNLVTYARTHTRYSTDNPSSHPVNRDDLRLLFPDNLPLAFPTVSAGSLSVPGCGYRNQVNLTVVLLFAAGQYCIAHFS